MVSGVTPNSPAISARKSMPASRSRSPRLGMRARHRAVSDGTVNGFAPPAGETPLVEDLRGFVVGVLGEQLVDEGDGGLGGGVLLPGLSGRGTVRVCCCPPGRRTWAVTCSSVLSKVTSPISRDADTLTARAGVTTRAGKAGALALAPPGPAAVGRHPDGHQ